MCTVFFHNRTWSLAAYVDAYRAEQNAARASVLSQDRWVVPAALTDKVDHDGRLRPFFGDTTVFPVRDPDVLASLTSIKSKLYARCGDMLADTLETSTFHMTLHDLSNSPDNAIVAPEMQVNRERFEACQQTLLTPHCARMRATGLFPCLNISVLLGLIPVDEESFRHLAQAYHTVDRIRPIHNWPRFHITLAYFRPHSFSSSDRVRLDQAIHAITTDSITWAIPLDTLEYQRFSSMNHYQS
jgi:hypothetical protein